MLNTLRKVEDRENHVRWIYLATVLNMGEIRKDDSHIFYEVCSQCFPSFCINCCFMFSLLFKFWVTWEYINTVINCYWRRGGISCRGGISYVGGIVCE